jgi:hypothetical protein
VIIGNSKDILENVRACIYIFITLTQIFTLVVAVQLTNTVPSTTPIVNSDEQAHVVPSTFDVTGDPYDNAPITPVYLNEPIVQLDVTPPTPAPDPSLVNEVPEEQVYYGPEQEPVTPADMSFFQAAYGLLRIVTTLFI